MRAFLFGRLACNRGCGYGIRAEAGTVTTTASELYSNDYGIYAVLGTVGISESALFSNNQNGLYNLAAPQIDVYDNFWGISTEPGTGGDNVSSGVSYDPWHHVNFYWSVRSFGLNWHGSTQYTDEWNTATSTWSDAENGVGLFSITNVSTTAEASLIVSDIPGYNPDHHDWAAWTTVTSAPTVTDTLIFSVQAMTDMSANCTGGTYPDYKTHVAIHELGHALGLGHSDPVTSDVIYSIVNTTHHQLNLTAGDKSDYNFLWDIAFRPESVQSWSEVDFDNYRFFNYELFFCFITILLQMKKYPEAAYFIHSKYFYRNTTGELRQSGFEIFNRHVRSLDEFRNNRLGLRRVSVTADLIKARATHKDVHFEDIRQTDLLLHYVSQLRGERFQWFPRTSVYGGRGSGIEIFERMISERHFQKIKALLDVDTVDELKTLIAQCVARSNADQRSYSGLWDYDVRPIENVIDVQSIATIR